MTLTIHWPQEPPPPQADETKIPLLANAPKSLPPAGKVIAFSGSSLMLIVISPESTNFDLAKRMIATNTKTIAVKATTPSKRIFNSLIIVSYN